MDVSFYPFHFVGFSAFLVSQENLILAKAITNVYYILAYFSLRRVTF